jgi:hypothetical protein
MALIRGSGVEVLPVQWAAKRSAKEIDMTEADHAESEIQSPEPPLRFPSGSWDRFRESCVL